MKLRSSDYLTELEYLDVENNSELRSEYYAGHCQLMPATHSTHSLIKTICSAEIGFHIKLSKDFHSYSSIQRINIPANGFYGYPDVLVVKGRDLISAMDPNAIINPVVLLEVYTAASEEYDRRFKFNIFQEIDTLMEYVLVSSETLLVEVFSRQSDNTFVLTSSAHDWNGSVHIRSIDLNLRLSDIYAKSRFDPENIYLH